MKSHLTAGLRSIHLYEVGDLLLEADRFAPAVPFPLKTLGGTTTQPEKPAEWLVDIAKPKAEDLPALTSALQVLKFSPDDVKKYHELIGTAVNIASACVWVVGAVVTVASVLKTLFGSEEDETTARLKHISMRVDQIYGYLALQNRKGLFEEAVTWRENLDTARNAINNARVSRSAINLNALVERKDQLDIDLGTMLDPGKASIAFQRAVYGYPPHPASHQGVHWIDSAASPYMTLADGTAVNYREAASELQTAIWDPAHYIDVLLSGLIDRLLLLATTEPAFRSTFYDMEQVREMSNGLTAFINKWRASILIAHPSVGLNNGGPMMHAETTAPPGIAVGAIDPVTGVAFYHPFWADFTYLETWKGSIAAKGKPDETRAKFPQKALADALALQQQLFDGAMRVSGISKLVELRARLQDILTFTTVGSDFVDLPNAGFQLSEMTGPAAQIEQVDLGFVGTYSKNPNRKYDGKRYWQTAEKRFRFAMPLRTDVSQVQVGYRIEFGDRSLPLIPFSVAPGMGNAPRFPTQPLSMEIRAADWTVYDVYQSVVFRKHDEDEFEGGVASPPVNGFDSLPKSMVPFVPIPISLVPAERLFLNERKGPVAMKIDVTFEADLNSPEQPFVGFANVSIRNLDPQACPGGVILPVTVFETRVVDKAGRTEEFIADRMTIHLVPSFLVLGPDYFTDRRDGMEAIDRVFGAINRKYAIQEQDVIPIGPEWAIRRRALEEVAMVNAIQRFARAEPEVASNVLGNYQMPMPVASIDSTTWAVDPNVLQFDIDPNQSPLTRPTA